MLYSTSKFLRQSYVFEIVLEKAPSLLYVKGMDARDSCKNKGLEHFALPDSSRQETCRKIQAHSTYHRSNNRFKQKDDASKPNAGLNTDRSDPFERLKNRRSADESVDQPVVDDMSRESSGHVKSRNFQKNREEKKRSRTLKQREEEAEIDVAPIEVSEGSKRKLTFRKRVNGFSSKDKSGVPVARGMILQESNILESISKTPRVEEYCILDASFFLCDALDLAPRLLGKLLRRDDVILQITEVEAYRQNDTACHARVGCTSRTAPMFGPGGHAYVYLCYGMHTMLNIVADQVGVGAAILIRACAPIAGIKTIQQRRGQNIDKPILLAGPGKVGKALALGTEWSHHPLYTPGGLELLDGPSPDRILVGPRVGIDYASPEDIAAPWRFAIAGSAWVSPPHKTLQMLE